MFDWEHDGEMKPVVTQKFEIEYGDEWKSLAQLEYSIYQNSEVGRRLIDYLIKYYWTNFKLLIETLTEKLGLELQRSLRLNKEINQKCLHIWILRKIKTLRQGSK